MSDYCNAVLLDVAAAVNSAQTGGKLKLGCMWHLKVKAGGLLVVLLEQKDNEMTPLCFFSVETAGVLLRCLEAAQI